MEFTAQSVLAFSGVVLSVVAFYVPGYKRLSDANKQWANLGAIGLVSFGALGLSCLEWLAYLPCSMNGLGQAVLIFFGALALNVTTFRSTKYILKK